MTGARAGKLWAARALILVGALAFAAAVVANWPGHFPPDAISQLAQGRSGVFNFWHPPVMAWLLGLADRLSPDAAAFIVFDAALFFAGLAALALVDGASWLAVIAMALLAASPLVLIYQGLAVKDVLFTDSSLAAFAALAWAGRLWSHRRARWALMALALVLLTLAALARQNGAIIAAAGAVTLELIARANTSTRTPVGLATVLALTMIGAGYGFAEAEFAAHSDRQPEVARQWERLQIYDLAGEMRRDPALPLTILRQHAPDLERFVRTRAAPHFDPTKSDTIAALPEWTPLIKAPNPWPGVQWRQVMTSRPDLYFRTRWAVFWQLFGTPDIQANAPVLVGVDPSDPRMLRKAGLEARDTDKDDWDGDYATAFLGTPVFSHPFYAALALVLLALAIRDAARAAPGAIAVAGLISGALVFAASFFVIAISGDYRYLYLLDVAAMAALVHRVATGFRRPPPAWDRAPRPPPPPS